MNVVGLSSEVENSQGRLEAVEEVELLLKNHSVREYMYIHVESILLSEKLRHICEHYCPNYNRLWGCPPNVGEIDENIRKCKQYKYGLVFSIMNTYDASNSSFDSNLNRSKRDLNHLMPIIAESMKELFGDVLYFNSACGQCKECTFPNHPCRFPQWKAPTTESYGIILKPILEKHDFVRYVSNEGISLFGLILFNVAPSDEADMDRYIGRKVTLFPYKNIPTEGETYRNAMIAEKMYRPSVDMASETPLIPGIYPINGATKADVCVLTGNYSLTTLVVQNKLKANGMPINLLIMDCSEHPVLCAWAEESISAESITDYIRTIENKLTSRRLIIPGKIKQILPELQMKLPDWKIEIGSDEI